MDAAIVISTRDRPALLEGAIGAARAALRAGDDPATAGSGANMAFRREAFDAVGGFDREFGPGARFRAAEDHELFWRVLRAGWVGRYTPDAVVVHEQWRGFGAFFAASFGYGFGSGALAAKVASVDAA